MQRMIHLWTHSKTIWVYLFYRGLELLGKCVRGRLNVVIKLLVKHLSCTKCFIGSAGPPGRDHSNSPAARIKQRGAQVHLDWEQNVPRERQ